MHQLYDRNLGADWQQRVNELATWQPLYNVDPGELWETHNALKNRLLDFMRRRMVRDCLRRHEDDAAVEAARNALDPSALTLGFARRFATYKRADLFLREFDQLLELVNDEQRPMQMIFAGKAHPADEPGKQLIKKVANLRHDPRFKNRIVFVEDYDINVARHLVQGVDVWLNNPIRPKEASGTSGMKAALNGAPSFSVLDGWWIEGHEEGVTGWCIGDGWEKDSDPARESASLYDKLENLILPMFYNHTIEYARVMRSAIAFNGSFFNAQRMVSQYLINAYHPAHS
jgi:starch phosphorylase